MVAARTGKPDAVSALLARGADPNAKEGWRGQTALMWAAAEGHAAVIDTLVARGADLNARSNAGFTALLFAAREGRIAAVEALLKAGADLNDSLPVRRRGRQARRRRRPAGQTPAAPEVGLNAFLLAAGNAHYELAAWLLDRGADPNAAPQGYTALHQVSWVRKAGIAGSNNPAPQGSGSMDSLTFVRTLVAKGAQLNARVTKRPNMGVTTLNSIGATPFLLAARTADAPLMKLLAELGADPRLTNEDGSTPLMVAAGLGTNAPGEDPGTEPEVLEAVKVALALGNDLNAVDKNGETAMHGAAYKHVPSVVRYLAEKGARMDVWNRPNSKGWTPLKITEGVQRGMNIVSSPATAAVIRQVMARSRGHLQPRPAEPPRSHIHDRVALLEALDRIATRPGSVFVRDEAGVSGLRNRVGDEAVVELLRVVDLLPAGNAGRVNVADEIEVVAHVADDVAVHDLHVVDVVDDLHAR